MPKLILHHIDVLNEEYVSGWCFNRITPARPLLLDIYAGNRLLGRTKCDRFREDVRQAGLNSTGLCGFEFKFPKTWSDNWGSELRVTCYKGLVTLFRTPTKSIPEVLSPAKTIFFVHIPKTAGTSFNNHVHSWFGFQKWYSHIEVLERDSQRALINPGYYLAGHIPLYKLKGIEPDFTRFELHTIFRRPIDQLHSHLSWLKGIGTDPNSGFFKAHQPVIQELSLNIQDAELHDARGIERFINNMEGFQFDFFDNIQTRYMLNNRPDKVKQVDLSQATENLTLFSTIGITESYQDYLDRCATLYRRSRTVQTTRHNPAKVSDLFDKNDPSILSTIEPLIEFDNTLYQTVIEDKLCQN